MKTLLLIMFLLVSINLSAQKSADSLSLLKSFAIHFDFGKYDIRPDADSVLRQVVEYCRQYKRLSLQITAHTDSIGTNKNNLTLSVNRAKAVKAFLSEKGMPADNFSISVFGEARPLADNTSEEGRQRNRRATIKVFQKRELTTLEGIVLNKDTGKGIVANIIVRTKQSRDSLMTDSSGFFRQKVPVGAVVGVDVYAKGFFLETQMLKAVPSPMKPLKIEMKPAREGEVVDIKNLYFVGNQEVLLKRSEPALPKILKFMQINDSLKIEIAGHINFPNRPPVTKLSWEYRLSVRRAKFVYDYLIKNGISPERLTFKGYGNWEMRNPKATSSKEQELNRRVEIRILETKKKNRETKRK